MKTTTKKKKIEATVEAVKAAAGRTWFDCSDEGDHIELSSRSHGDVGEERAGEPDKAEGHRLHKEVSATFKPSSWVVTYEVVDEWVSVSVRKLPLTKKEKAIKAMEAKMTKLRVRLQEVAKAASLGHTSNNQRQAFTGSVIDGHSYFKPYLKVVFGERRLYHSHLQSGFTYANEDEAQAALKPLIEQFPEYEWTRTVMEPRARHTYNYSPPNNVIEMAGYIEYEAHIRKA